MTFVQSQTNIFWKIFPIHARLFVETRQQEVKKELEAEMKLKDEAKERHIDPQELTAFQEHLSAKAQVY